VDTLYVLEEKSLPSGAFSQVWKEKHQNAFISGDLWSCQRKAKAMLRQCYAIAREENDK
jgi:hypothetical protein